MAASQYEPQYPPGSDIDQKCKDFISNFYRISDLPDAHVEYAAQFADDAVFVIRGKEAVGNEGKLVCGCRPNIHFISQMVSV